MGYIDRFVESVIENGDERYYSEISDYIRNSDSLDNFLTELETLLDNNIDSFMDLEEYLNLSLEGILRLKGIDDVEEIIGNEELEKIVNAYKERFGDDEEIFDELKYYLFAEDFKDFKNKFNQVKKFIEEHGKGFYTSKYPNYDELQEILKTIINNKEYNVNKEQTEFLSDLVYWNFDDKSKTSFQKDYEATSLWNQLALNAIEEGIDEEKALQWVESNATGWYAEDFEKNLDVVDMVNYSKEMKKQKREEKRNNTITDELINKLKEQYPFLKIEFRKGSVGLENQTNDYLAIYAPFQLNNEKEVNGMYLVYEDDGSDNDFGDTSLLFTDNLKQILENIDDLSKILLI